jgi:hypothetical protein
VISFPDSDRDSFNNNLVSAVVNIDLYTKDGEPIEALSANIDICIQVEDKSTNNKCLGFLTQNDEWICQDKCLEQNGDWLW